jgi:hypothetical protein
MIPDIILRTTININFRNEIEEIHSSVRMKSGKSYPIWIEKLIYLTINIFLWSTDNLSAKAYHSQLWNDLDHLRSAIRRSRNISVFIFASAHGMWRGE